MPTTNGRDVLLAEQQRTHRRRRVTLLVVASLVLLVGAGWSVVRGRIVDLLPPGCTATAGRDSVSLSPEQTANAATIAAISVKRQMPARAATIAIATALQESKLRNLTVGDRDSVGLFQQRPSQGWGTPEQILDPVYATNAFFDRLVKVEDYPDRPITEVAQQVQRSGHPTAYAQHEDEARVLASVLTGQSAAGLVCRLTTPSKPADPAAVSAALERQLGVTAAGADDSLVVAATDTLAWATAAWAVAHADARAILAVQVDAQAWNRASSDRWAEATPADGVRLTLSR
ncbi:MAG: hypothetical protein ACOYBY_03955 [Dermatophilaceae bacterium]